MNCRELQTKLPELLFESGEAFELEQMSAVGESSNRSLGDEAVRTHLAGCDACRQELAELRATMALLDMWEAPEPNPYFLTRLDARLEDERAAPAGWFERLKARLTYGAGVGSRRTLRPVMAMAMTAILLVGGGAYMSWNALDTSTTQPQAAVVHDLQTLDNNAQLLDQLESLSVSDNSDNND